MNTEQLSPDAPELQRIYSARFSGITEYRTRVWRELAPFVQRYLPANAAVLDLGAGYCEFINNAAARTKYAMDLNPDVNRHAADEVTVLQQDCSHAWPIQAASLDAVFTSNFLEHLPDKRALTVVLSHAFDSLKPGGRFIALGPNIRVLNGSYWDFFDHYIQLSEKSLAEALVQSGFEIETCVARFLPYTMSHGRRYPIWLLRLYLWLPLFWRIFGKQFLVVGKKPTPR